MATRGNAASYAELASRVYTGNVATPEVVEALREANPTLTDLGSTPPGTIVLVPDVAGAGHSEESQPMRAGMAQLGMTTLALRLAAVGPALDSLAGSKLEEARARLAALKSPEVEAPIAQDAGAASRLRAVVAQAEDDLAAAEALSAGLPKLVAALAVELQSFSRVHTDVGC